MSLDPAVLKIRLSTVNLDIEEAARHIRTAVRNLEGTHFTATQRALVRLADNLTSAQDHLHEVVKVL